MKLTYQGKTYSNEDMTDILMQKHLNQRNAKQNSALGHGALGAITAAVAFIPFFIAAFVPEKLNLLMWAIAAVLFAFAISLCSIGVKHLNDAICLGKDISKEFYLCEEKTENEIMVTYPCAVCGKELDFKTTQFTVCTKEKGIESVCVDCEDKIKDYIEDNGGAADIAEALDAMKEK